MDRTGGRAGYEMLAIVQERHLVSWIKVVAVEMVGGGGCGRKGDFRRDPQMPGLCRGGGRHQSPGHDLGGGVVSM